jgi:L-glyceraldehyde 3-phosphate reductase
MMITQDVNPSYVASPDRYKSIEYSRTGKSGLRLPKLSLGLWQNFGAVDALANSRSMLRTAFDLGINHFDLANNYGPPYGAAEITFGNLYRQDFHVHRDELIISSKAGYDMWPGPFGVGGSRKYLVASCDQSLKRTGLQYFDIFYHHCMDPDTPIEESMSALDYIVRSGRALYAGISNYGPQETREAARILRGLGTPLLIHQPRYNLLDRWIEQGLTDVLKEEGVGAIAFSPLAQGILTNKYLNGVPSNSRAARIEIVHLVADQITPEKIQKAQLLNAIAASRGQSLAQMALAWILRNDAISSCLIGARNTEQINDSFKALTNLNFSQADLAAIGAVINP